MNPDDLSLASIDGMRHVVASEYVVRSTAFAARAGHSDSTAYRFVTALVMVDALTDRAKWSMILTKIMDLQWADNEKET